jgi:hypothetical protein
MTTDDNGTYTQNLHNLSILVYIHQKKKIAPASAAKFASVNGLLFGAS